MIVAVPPRRFPARAVRIAHGNAIDLEEDAAGHLDGDVVRVGLRRPGGRFRDLRAQQSIEGEARGERPSP